MLALPFPFDRGTTPKPQRATLSTVGTATKQKGTDIR
jgi:hypothetical protein